MPIDIVLELQQKKKPMPIRSPLSSRRSPESERRARALGFLAAGLLAGTTAGAMAGTLTPAATVYNFGNVTVGSAPTSSVPPTIAS